MPRSYTYITSRTSPNQNARNRKISGITIHWWGKPSGQSIEGVVNWLCQKRAGTSAHYVVSDGIVYCIVDPDRRAWHAGDSAANHHQIGLELDPNPGKRAGTMRTAAALIADLRAEYGSLPLSPHRKWTSTECPGDIDLGELDRLAGAGSTPPPPKVPAGGTSVPAPAPSGRLKVDGRLGHETVRALQEWLNRKHGAGLKVDGKAGHSTWRALQAALGAPYRDGEISRQSYAAHELGNGITQGWEHTGPRSKGSQTVVLLQRLIGATADGIWGEGTTAALQRYLNAEG